MSRKVWRGIWDKEGRKCFREGFGRVEEEGNTTEEEWKKMVDRIKDIMRKVEQEREREKGDKREGRRWWDKECKKMKKEVRGKLREWRRKGGMKEYTGKRRSIKKYVIRKGRRRMKSGRRRKQGRRMRSGRSSKGKGREGRR